MFKSVGIQGYKSIRSQKVSLGRMNILIGGNGAGKSNFLSVFNLVKAVSEEGLDAWVEENGGANRILHLGRKNTSGIQLSFWFNNEDRKEQNELFLAFEESADRLALKYVGTTSSEDARSFHTSSQRLDGEEARLFSPLRVYHFVDFPSCWFVLFTHMYDEYSRVSQYQ